MLAKIDITALLSTPKPEHSASLYMHLICHAGRGGAAAAAAADTAGAVRSLPDWRFWPRKAARRRRGEERRMRR